MGGDVAAGAAGGIVAQLVGEPVDEAEAALGARGIAQALGVAHEQVEQGHRVGRGPFAPRPGLVPADAARGGEADQREPAVQGDDRLGPGVAETDAARGPVGEDAVDPALEDALVEPVEQAGKGGRDEASRKAGPGGEAAVCGQEVGAAGGHVSFPKR